MKTQTRIRAGSITLNHNETLICDSPRRGELKVKRHVKVGRGRIRNGE
jgi:hypothetical protein